jgi:hypothetical protein
MPTINQLPLLAQVSPGDQFAVYTPNNGDARRLPVSSLLTFFQQNFASPSLSVNLYVPGTGFNIQAPTPVSQQQWILLQPAGVLASGTVTLPLNTLTPDGTEILITSTQTITAFSIGLNSATAIYGGVTTLTAGSAVRFRFYQPTNSWYNITNETSGLNAAIQAFLNNPTSANLRAAMTDETGTGLLVFNDTPTLVTPVIGAATGTSLSTTGSQLITGTGKQGYNTGSGGTVTQLTNKATGVTLDKTNGSITMDAANLGANTTVSFTLTNNTIEAGDILVMNHISGGTAGSYLLNAQSAAGSASINVRNITAGALAEAIVIRFAVIKAVSA